MTTFWEIAAHSVDHMLSLYFDFIFRVFLVVVFCLFVCFVVVFLFVFWGVGGRRGGGGRWIYVLIASVPNLCLFLLYYICVLQGCIHCTDMLS